jgi:hypothetical protein
MAMIILNKNGWMTSFKLVVFVLAFYSNLAFIKISHLLTQTKENQNDT